MISAGSRKIKMTEKHPLIAYACYRRPEFLKVNLKQLLKNPELSKYEVLFTLDHGYDPQVEEVIQWFAKQNASKDVLVFKLPEKMSAMPATANIMAGYLIATQRSDSYFIPAEEDIIPSTDFLRFNEYVYDNYLSKHDRLGWVAHKRRLDPIDGDPSVLIGDYQSTSPSCIPIKIIENHLLKHINNPMWYENPQQYNMQHFLKSRIMPHIFLDHDCMLERIMEQDKLFVLKPDHARSAHIGFTGGISGRDKGEDISAMPFDARVEMLEEIIYDTQALKEKAHVNKHDIIGLPFEKEWQLIVLDTDRDRAVASSWHYDLDNEFRDYMVQRIII